MSRSLLALYSLYFARPSEAHTPPISSINSVSKAAPSPIACGKLVAVPALATPCRVSFHQLYSGIPNLSIAGESYLNCDTASSTVILPTSSSALLIACSLFIDQFSCQIDTLIVLVFGKPLYLSFCLKLYRFCYFRADNILNLTI